MNVDAIKQALAHPVIDADGHTVEYSPLLRDFIAEEAGEAVADKWDLMLHTELTREQRREKRVGKTFWGFPAENTLDRATAMTPNLMYERLDEFGIDFAMVYPTFGLLISSIPDAELRCAFARACNRYYSEVMFDHRDRMEPVATIPMTTPEEAIAELNFAVGERGMKAVTMAGAIPRRLPGAGRLPGAIYVDTVAHDSLYDYDPVWRRCVELGVSPTFHGVGYGWGARVSSSNYVFNHVGHFAAAQEATCRSIVLGGVARRFPELRFSFLEGGIAWAATLCADLIGHFEKRNVNAEHRYDPRRVDRQLLTDLMRRHGDPRVIERLDRVEHSLKLGSAIEDDEIDDFEAAGIRTVDDIVELFAQRFFFGCEADDPMTAIAFDRSLPPVAHEMHPLFASDIGHFDVPDMNKVLPEAWELVERSQLDLDQFRAFTFSNAAEFWTTLNPSFFAGTVVADAVIAWTSAQR